MNVSVDDLVRKSDPYELGGPLQRAGMAWNGVCGHTVLQRYRTHFAPPASGRNDNHFRSDPQDDEAVTRGEHDGAIRRAAATAILALGATRGINACYVNHYLDAVQVTIPKVSQRLKAMGARTAVMRGWAEDLRAEHAAVEASLAGSCFYELDKNGERESDDEWVLLRVGVHADYTETVAFCALADVAEPDEEDEELFLLEDVVGYIEGRGSAPPEEPEAYEAPAPPPPPVSPLKRTRAERDAAELLETQRSWLRSGARTQSKAARRDRAAWEAEAKDDVEDDDEYFIWEPPRLEFGEDSRPTKKLRRYALLDESDVKLLASEPFECMTAPLLAKGVPRSSGLDILRIGRVSYEFVGDPTGDLLRTAISIVRDHMDAKAINARGEGLDVVSLADGVNMSRKRAQAKCLWLHGHNDGTFSEGSRSVVGWVEHLAAQERGKRKKALTFFAALLKRGLETRTLEGELACYGEGDQGNEHVDAEVKERFLYNDHTYRGGQPAGTMIAGPIVFRLALSVQGSRSMSIFGNRGAIATIQRSAAERTGALFLGGAHTWQRGEFRHRNDYGEAKGTTLILTFRKDVSGKFAHMSEAERLLAHYGLALSNA